LKLGMKFVFAGFFLLKVSRMLSLYLLIGTVAHLCAPSHFSRIGQLFLLCLLLQDSCLYDRTQQWQLYQLQQSQVSLDKQAAKIPVMM